jgi:hypothetical protein
VGSKLLLVSLCIFNAIIWGYVVLMIFGVIPAHR